MLISNEIKQAFINDQYMRYFDQNHPSYLWGDQDEQVYDIVLSYGGDRIIAEQINQARLNGIKEFEQALGI